MEIIIITIAVVLILLLLIWYISVSNKLNKLLVKIDEASSGIDIALTQRYDVLTKMIDVVKAYSKHEKETLFEVVNIRTTMTLEEKKEANNHMNHNYDQIKLLVENYPDLKASENYNTLQQSIVEVEEQLQAARRLYNSNVSTYNQTVVTFPNTIIASMKRLTKKEFFEAKENKKEDVKIKL